MALNTYVIVAALAAGLVMATTALLLRGRPGSSDRSLRPWQLVVAAAVGFGLNGGAVIGSWLLVGRDQFAAIHVTYLWVTVALPVAAAAIVVGGRPIRSPVSSALLVVALGLAPLGLYMTHIEPFRLRVDRVELTSPSVKEPFRIGVLADLQTPSVGEYELNAVDRLIALDPDLVLIPGDFYQLGPDQFDARFAEFRSVIEELARSVPLVVVVNGNTDRISGLRRLTEDTDAVLLNNQVLIADVGGNTVQIIGISMWGDETAASAVIDGAATPPQPVDMTVLLSHKPDEVARVGNAPVDLVVSGHTHGGQVTVPFIGPPLTLSSVPRRVAAGGLHTLNGTPIYVSTGVGLERGYAPQMRLGVRPSLGLIEVVPGS